MFNQLRVRDWKAAGNHCYQAEILTVNSEEACAKHVPARHQKPSGRNLPLKCTPHKIFSILLTCLRISMQLSLTYQTCRNRNISGVKAMVSRDHCFFLLEWHILLEDHLFKSDSMISHDQNMILCPFLIHWIIQNFAIAVPMSRGVLICLNINYWV